MASGSATRARRLTRAVGYAVAVAVPIVVLAFLVRTQFGPLVDADRQAIASTTSFTAAHPAVRSWALAWEAVSQPWVMYLVVGLPACAIAWWRLRLRTRAVWAVATMATGWALASTLKLVVQRARPVVEEPFAAHSGYSFPSGHTTNNTIVVTVVLLLLAPALGRRARRVLTGVAVLWVALTCLDRLLVGAHFPSDVVAGVLLGLGVGVASYAGYVGWTPPTPDPTKETSP